MLTSLGYPEQELARLIQKPRFRPKPPKDDAPNQQTTKCERGVRHSLDVSLHFTSAMSRDATAIIADLNRYSGSTSTWPDLDELSVELFRNPVDGAGLDALFGVFERHPTNDGFGVFWTLLHGIESVPDYELHLLQSLRRRPSLFAVYMINRILNVGEQDVDGVSLIAVLREILSRRDIEQEIRDESDHYLQRHAG